MDFTSHILLVIRLSLGLIFLASAIPKLLALHTFVEGVLNYEILPRSVARLFGFALPFVELATAAMLLVGILTPIASGTAVFLLTSFAFALGINAARGREVACHCFGIDKTSSVGWHSLVRDMLLLPPAIYLTWATWFSHKTVLLSLDSVTAALGISSLVTLLYMIAIEGLDVLFSTRSVPN